MTKTWLALLALLVSLPAAAQSCATPVFDETFVDPRFFDCRGTGGPGERGWAGSHAGGENNGSSLDGDNLIGPGAVDEDSDIDAIFGTIGDAISCTNTGGTVHVVVPGMYREALKIGRSMTLRGAHGVDVVLEGGRELCALPGAGATAITLTPTSNEVFRIEGFTIRGYTGGVGIFMSGGSDATLIVKDCRIENNDIGILTDDIAIIDTTEVFDNLRDGISWNGYGGTDTISVSGCRLEHNGRHGFHHGGEVASNPVVITDTWIARNGEHGINISGFSGQSSTRHLVVESCHVSENVKDGIHMAAPRENTLVVSRSAFDRNGNDGIDYSRNATSQTTPMLLMIDDCQFQRNGGNGVIATTLGIAPVDVTLSDSAFIGNGLDGINLPAVGTVSCIAGRNTATLNATGQYVGGAGVCMPGAPVNANQ